MALEHFYDIKRAYSSKQYTLDDIHPPLKDFLKTAPADDDDLKLKVWKLVSEFADYEMVDYLITELDWQPRNITDGYSNVLHFLANKGDASYFDMPKNRVYETAIRLIDARVSMLKKDGYELTPLMGAAKNGQLEFIQACIDKEVKIGGTGKEGETLLHLIAEYCGRDEESYEKYEKPKYDKEMSRDDYDETRNYMRENRAEVIARNQRIVNTLDGFYKSARLLMEQGLDPSEKNNYGQTAIEVAVHYNGKKIAAILNGLNTESENAELELQAGGMNIFQVCEKKDAVALNAILQMGADPNSENDDANSRYDKMLPLNIALLERAFDCVDTLLDAGANPSLFNSLGYAPMRYFLYVDYVKDDFFKEKRTKKIVENFIAHGYDIDSKVDEDENTILILASENYDSGSSSNGNTVSCIFFDEIINKNPDINKSNKHGETALMKLCSLDRAPAENALITLLEEGADVGAKDKNGKTVMMYAVQNSNKSYAKNFCELLEQFGDILVSAVDNNGKSALDYAVENENEPLVKWLLERQ